MVVGDRVKLRRSLAEQFSKNTRGMYRKVNWINRIGHIVEIGRPENAISSQHVGVRWDDRRTLDHWPLKALVVVKARS
jgi:hypothetical protein